MWFVMYNRILNDLRIHISQYDRHGCKSLKRQTKNQLPHADKAAKNPSELIVSMEIIQMSN